MRGSAATGFGIACRLAAVGLTAALALAAPAGAAYPDGGGLAVVSVVTAAPARSDDALFGAPADDGVSAGRLADQPRQQEVPSGLRLR